MKLDVQTLDAKKAGSVDLSDFVFALKPRTDILHRMVNYQLAKRRAGTHKTKGRSEIAGTTKKMYKQKGTGGARHGNKKVPQFRGGGKAFGPVVRDHSHGLTKKVRALALRHALSTKAQAGSIIVLDEAKLPEPRTKAVKDAFAKLGITSTLIVDGSQLDENFALAARNIPHTDVLPIEGINVYDVLRRDTLVLTKAALEALEARFAS
ncbi:50S ribosomal protein L4 [Pyruvatibacter sp.]|uniref:50S ribosomal protein L4 n=1 Tax=Pyruvatibacter sp. TaxID=1981328 RepID=UPI0032EC3602